MNRKTLLFLFIISIFAFKPADNFVNIAKAVKSGLVSVSIKVNTESIHYIKPLLITVQNIKTTPVTIKIPDGMQFFPEDSSYQNLITTHEELLTIYAGKSVTIPVFAMCTESKDRGPSSGVVYKPGKPASDKVIKLAQYIDKHKLHDPLGQSAIWAMTSGAPLEDINGFDTSAARQLIKYVADALGKPIPPPPSDEDTRRNYYATNYASTMSGSFNYNFYKKTAVAIAMFNKDNIVVRELYRNPAEAPGQHKLEYKFDATEYKDDIYYLRLIADGEIILSGKIDNRNKLNRN